MTLSRKQWYDFFRKCRKNGYDILDQQDDPYDHRMSIQEAIRKYAVNGKISINISAMDCDCSKYTSGSIIDAVPLVAVHARMNYEYDGAEGPMSVWIDTPANKVGYSSRDLALEAFEDGHPHSVSEVRYETH